MVARLEKNDSIPRFPDDVIARSVLARRPPRHQRSADSSRPRQTSDSHPMKSGSERDRDREKKKMDKRRREESKRFPPVGVGEVIPCSSFNIHENDDGGDDTETGGRKRLERSAETKSQGDGDDREVLNGH